MLYFNQATYNPATYELTLIKHTEKGYSYKVDTLKTTGVHFQSNPILHNKNGVMTWTAKPNKVWYVNKKAFDIKTVNDEWMLTNTDIHEFDLRQTGRTFIADNIYVSNDCIKYQSDGKEHSLMFDTLEIKRVAISQTVYQNNMLIMTFEGSSLMSLRWGITGLIVEIN